MKTLATLSMLLACFCLRAQDVNDESYMTVYVVVADTGLKYHDLKKQMIQISNNHCLSIDSMGRSYDSQKNLICLPEDDQDEIYAGNYFPRRFPDTFLSLEYMALYQRDTRENNLGIVAGIFEEKSKVDSLHEVIKINALESFVVESYMYMGCLH